MVEICGIIKIHGVPTEGVTVEALRCSDDTVVISQVTTEIEVDGDQEFNYHLSFRQLDPDADEPLSQCTTICSFINTPVRPIGVYLRISSPGCPDLEIPCEQVANAYCDAINCKPRIDVDQDLCPIILSFDVASNLVSLTMTAHTTGTYQVEVATNTIGILSQEWNTVWGPVPGTAATMSAEIPAADVDTATYRGVREE